MQPEGVAILLQTERSGFAVLLSIIFGFGGFVGALVSMFKSHSDLRQSGLAHAERFARIELKVDTMWDFQLRRGVTEAVTKGFGEKNSPLKISQEALDFYDGPFSKELTDFYRTEGHGLSVRNLIIEIEGRWGMRIATEICMPRGISESSCLLIAAAVATGNPTVAVPETTRTLLAGA